jgi:hypothetical protein
MALRKSGKNALIQLVEVVSGVEQTPFDISGVGTDGRSRANAFAFSIAGTVVDADGYNQPYTEPIPVGQSKVSGSLTVYYNVEADEVNELLWEIYEGQHDPESCTDPADYTIKIMPEGDCDDKELWSVTGFVIENLDIQMPFDGLMAIALNWRAWVPTRSTISGT